MRPVISIFLVLSAWLSLPATAADLPAAPRVAWTASFGGSAPIEAPALALSLVATDQRLGEAPRIVELEMGTRGTMLALAGMPFWQPNLSLGQAEDPGYESAAPPKPWYARQWIWWTAGGLAATAALASGGGEVSYDDTDTCYNCNDSNGPGTTVISGDPTGEAYVGCVEGEVCVLCPDGTTASNCNGGLIDLRRVAMLDRDVAHDAWLDAGTGHMGDLFAVAGAQ
jgi:hypothetical protein